MTKITDRRVAFKIYRRINIYAKSGQNNRVYLYSTFSARNLKEARERYAISTGTYGASDLWACYA